MEAPQGKYPAKNHARKAAEALGEKTGILYAIGQRAVLHESSDQEVHFRQRRNFFYLSGCDLADSAVTYDIGSDKLVLYIPPIDPESVIWSGLPTLPDEAKKIYDVDEVHTTDDLATFPQSVPSSTTIYTTHPLTSPICPPFESSKYTVDTEALNDVINKCRVVKDDYEIALTRIANDASSASHRALFARIKSATNERELEAAFVENCLALGCKNQAYDSIVASGTNAATLHYVHNDQPLKGRLNLLVDAGGEFSCYAADITRTVPLSGKFSPESKSIYELVLKMQTSCMNMIRHDALWDDIHARAHEIAIEGLLELGILRGNKKEIFDKRVSVAFFPHGLGHYLGMDTHDTGGNANYADGDSMFRYLRVRGRIPAGSVITVEPGIYFCRFILEPALKDEVKSKYIDAEILDKYWEVGGVRIEDDVLVLQDGYENLTTVASAADEIEALINAS
ncbi:hypothetical protein MMC25_001016 [Agyrium rufum]|nr:hypothetical protein [Agyrium rufum]